MVFVKLKVLENGMDLDLPSYATEHSAGMDLRAAVENDVVLEPGKRLLVKTGVAIALPEEYEAQIRPRSGLAVKHGVTIVNAPGTIDADYRGEIMVALINHGEEPFIITKGMRIAQMVIAKYVKARIQQVLDLEATKRGEGGFGSTGLQEIKESA